MDHTTCPYHVLGLLPGASDAAIKKTGKLLMVRNNPDYFSNDPANFQRVSKKLIEIRRCVDALTDDNTKRYFQYGQHRTHSEIEYAWSKYNQYKAHKSQEEADPADENDNGDQIKNFTLQEANSHIIAKATEVLDQALNISNSIGQSPTFDEILCESDSILLTAKLNARHNEHLYRSALKYYELSKEASYRLADQKLQHASLSLSEYKSRHADMLMKYPLLETKMEKLNKSIDGNKTDFRRWKRRLRKVHQETNVIAETVAEHKIIDTLVLTAESKLSKIRGYIRQYTKNVSKVTGLIQKALPVLEYKRVCALLTVAEKCAFKMFHMQDQRREAATREVASTNWKKKYERLRRRYKKLRVRNRETAQESSSTNNPPAITTAAFQCNDCGKQYSRREGLARHRKKHSGQKTHICKICARPFYRKDHLTRHQKTHRNSQ